MNYVREYWRKIESGEIITSRRVKVVYGRLVREMDEPPDGSPWYFDEETGERPIIFVERFCKQSQGTLGANAWHTVEILPDTMSRIVGAVFSQTFCNSRGGGDY